MVNMEENMKELLEVLKENNVSAKELVKLVAERILPYKLDRIVDLGSTLNKTLVINNKGYKFNYAGNITDLSHGGKTFIIHGSVSPTKIDSDSVLIEKGCKIKSNSVEYELDHAYLAGENILYLEFKIVKVQVLL